MAKIEDFNDLAPYDVFAAVTTKSDYEISFHETLEQAQEEAVYRCGEDSAYLVENGQIVMDTHACPDYSCYAGRVSGLIVQEIKSMASSDLAGLAAVVKRWSDALHLAGLRTSD